MKVWVLTSEYNEYDQHGEYLEEIWSSKPTREQLGAAMGCYPDSQEVSHVLAGGGRTARYESLWYYLREREC